MVRLLTPLAVLLPELLVAELLVVDPTALVVMMDS
jgi:hypothetical protein